MAAATFNLSKLAYIEAQIIHQASAENLLNRITREIESQYGLDPGVLSSGIFTQTRILSLLYLLIVVPKEYWSLDSDHFIYEQISSSWQLKNIQILTYSNSESYSSLYSFIHHLRNAISHANFQFNGDDFVFWDVNKKGLETYRAILSKSSLQQFLETVGAAFANFKK